MAIKSLFNEMYEHGGAVRPHYGAFADWLHNTAPEKIKQNREAADLLFHRVGITFAVYGEATGTERLIPFDIVPHIIPAAQWDVVSRGLKQRVAALNAFLHDVYHEQAILRAGKVPADKVIENSQFRPEMIGIDVPGGIYAHIAGIDLVKDGDGEYYVLEDNLRTPSGVSYLLENRRMMMRLFPELFAAQRVRPVDHYPDLLLDTLRNAAPVGVDSPTIVLMTPGNFNSAYFEHAFLAQQMGIELVEGVDLFVQDDTVFMRTTQGPQKVDVIYRRIDDDFIYVLEHLHELVVKEAQGSGGYGMLVGPTASKDERERYRQRILDAPERFIAHPTLSLSVCPTFVDKGLAPRHIDLRPYVLSGKSVNFVPGGLTRVALREGSLVVNSSQGGGVKDTWIVD